MENALATAVIEDVRKRLVHGFPPQVRASLAALTDEQIWWRPNAQSNSVGNLVLHVCGSTRLFLGRGVGGTDYVRDRPREFAERGPIPREELLRLLDETLDEARRVLDGVTPERLFETTGRVPGGPYTVLALLFRTSHHWAAHASQIVYAAKAMKEGAFDELWMKTMR